MTVQVLLERIDVVRQRERNVHTAAGLFKTLVLFVGLAAVFFVIDWGLIATVIEDEVGNRTVRAVLLLGLIGYVGYVFWRQVWCEFNRERDDDEIALRIEGRHPDLRGRLISTIQLTRSLDAGAEVGSAELIRALEEDTVTFAQALNFGEIINLQTFKRFAAFAGVAVSFTLIFSFLQPEVVWKLIQRMVLQNVEYPTDTLIAEVRGKPQNPELLNIEGYDVRRVPRGDGYVIEVYLEKFHPDKDKSKATLPDPDEVTMWTRTLPKPGQSAVTTEYTLTRDERRDLADKRQAFYGGFDPENPDAQNNGLIETVVESLEYRVYANDARSEWRRIDILHRPVVSELNVTYELPEYTKKSEEPSSGDIRVLTGSKASIVATLNKEVKKAEIEVEIARPGDDGKTVVETFKDKMPVSKSAKPDVVQEATYALRILHNGRYRILLNGVDGLKNPDPTWYRIRALKDRPPIVKIKFPARDKTVTKMAYWPIDYKARDDIGVERVFLKFRVTDVDEEASDEEGREKVDRAPVRSLKFPRMEDFKPDLDKDEARWFDLEKQNVEVGQKVTYWLEVQDGRAVYDEETEKFVPNPNVARSREYEFIIEEAKIVRRELERERSEAIAKIELAKQKEEENRAAVRQIRTQVGAEDEKPPGGNNSKNP